jgi:hypothetical protein
MLVTDYLLRDDIQRIVAVLDPATIIPFGSRAYRQPEPDSDMDWSVVTEALNMRSVFERHRAIFDLFAHRRLALDVLVRTPVELRQLVEQGLVFFKDIVTQRKVPYEQRGHRGGTRSRGGLSKRAHPAALAQDLSARQHLLELRVKRREVSEGLSGTSRVSVSAPPRFGATGQPVPSH